jgi:hypothetical protein
MSLLIEFLAKIAPGLLRLGLDLYVGKRMSDEEYHAFIAANKKLRDNIADTTNNIKLERERLKAELNRIKKLK